VGRLALDPPNCGQGSLIITCEHATNRLPGGYRNLGLSRQALTSHIAWDPGAREVARYCARRLACPYHEGKVSRLLVDLNRSPHHPKLIPKIAFGTRVPGNGSLSRQEKLSRLNRFYRPYREAVMRDIGRILDKGMPCVHLSFHSFTPRLGGRQRPTEIGILYDPAREGEREVARRLTRQLRELGLSVRRNYPYRGTADGLTSFCRRSLAERSYLGIELEINQRLLLPAVAPGLKRSVGGAIERTLASFGELTFGDVSRGRAPT
jgi:predicted N-formylglutamate amidohydrolase